jgi:hypothetical protein
VLALECVLNILWFCQIYESNTAYSAIEYPSKPAAPRVEGIAGYMCSFFTWGSVVSGEVYGGARP